MSNIPYKTLYRVVDGEIKPFSTQRKSYENLKENEFLTRFEAETYIESLQAEVEEDFYDEISDIEDLLVSLDDNINSLDDEIASLEDDRYELEDLNQSFVEQFGHTSGDIDQKIESIIEEIEDLNVQRDSYTDEVNDLEARLGAIDDDIGKTETYYANNEEEEEEEEEVQYVITPQNITVSYKGVTHTINKETGSFQDIMNALINGESPEKIMNMVDLAEKLKRETNNLVETDKGYLEIDGNMVPDALAQGILDAVLKNNDKVAEALKNFWGKLKTNPNEETIENLFNLMKNRKFAILENGNFLAYKYVRKDFRDVHTGKFDNTPGKVVAMKRDDVDHDNNVTCSSGLHVGAWEYVNGGGEKIVLCEVDPADVCAVPKDYNFQKVRCNKYFVVKEVTGPVAEGVINT